MPTVQTRFPSALQGERERIEAAARAAGLDFFPVRFELLAPRDVNALAAWGGFPVRYPMWRHGMEFDRLEKSRQWGLAKIYELVINNDPVVAYLVSTNSFMEQKLVMAHVFGHADFFKHNCHFRGTDRNMLERMAAHASCVRGWIDTRGQDAVERALDSALSLENLIDPFLALRAQGQAGSKVQAPTFDVLGFLEQYAPVGDMARQMLGIVRAEAYYFQPQRMTKIANEGWATYWHSQILTRGILEDSEVVDFADCHSAATQASPGQLNPYKLGLELYRHAARLGRDLFALRATSSDAALIDELVDEEFVTEQALFLSSRNARSGKMEVTDRDWRNVKRSLLEELAWGGLVKIELLGVGGELGQGEMVLEHHHDGRDLELEFAKQTLLCVARLWGAAAVLFTQVDDQKLRLVAQDGAVESKNLD